MPTPTGFTAFTAANIQDASGTPLALGSLLIQPTDNNNLPITARAGGLGGQMVCSAATIAVVAGSVGAGIVVADTSQTSPVNVSFRITVLDQQSRVLATYKGVQPTGATFNFDTYTPAVPAQAPYAAQGPPGANGVDGANGTNGTNGTAGPAGPPATFLGAYAGGTTYAIGQEVSSGGSSYVSLVNANTGNTPASSPTQWGLVAAAGANGTNGAPGAPGGDAQLILLKQTGDRTANLLNPAMFTLGVFHPGSSALDPLSGYQNSGLQSVIGFTKLMLNFAVQFDSFPCFDSSGNYIGGPTGSGDGAPSQGANTVISLPANTAYVSFYGIGTTAFGANPVMVGGTTANPPVMLGSFVSFSHVPTSAMTSAIAVAETAAITSSNMTTVNAVALLIANGVIPTSPNVFDVTQMRLNTFVQPPSDMYPANTNWDASGLMYAGSATHFMANFIYAYHDDFVAACFDINGSYIGYVSIPPVTWPIPANTPVPLLAGTVWFQLCFYHSFGGSHSTWMVVVGGATPTMPVSYVSFSCDPSSVVDSKIATSAVAVTASVAASIAALGGGLGAIPETRPASVTAVKNATVGVGAPQTIFNQTGAGSVERIQLAYTGSATELENSKLHITVDGTTFTTTCGMFFLNIGINDAHPAPTVGISEVFSTKWLERSICGQATQHGVGRRIYIPYHTGCTITYEAVSSTTQIYTQVEFYPGAPPGGLHPVSDKVFHMETIEYNTSAGVVPYATIQNLAAGTAGPGRLAHWHIAASGDATAISNVAGWLEFAPAITHDGVNFGAGGTEDFFGCQYYGTEFQPKADEWQFSVFTAAGSHLTYTLLARHFDKMPIPFTTSLGPLTWANGQGGLGPTPLPTQKIGMQVVWYTAA